MRGSLGVLIFFLFGVLLTEYTQCMTECMYIFHNHRFIKVFILFAPPSIGSSLSIIFTQKLKQNIVFKSKISARFSDIKKRIQFHVSRYDEHNTYYRQFSINAIFTCVGCDIHKFLLNSGYKFHSAKPSLLDTPIFRKQLRDS